MSDDRTFQDAKRLYLEQYGDPMVTNTYLKIALTLVSLIAVGLLVLDLKTIRTFENFRPLVIRIDDLGRAEAINYHNLEYKPQDAEAKYFLSQFCALYYRRNRYTIQDDFSKALYFLDGKLADGILDAYRKDDIIKKFLMNTSAAGIDIEVKKVALEDMQSPPFRPARISTWFITPPPTTARSNATFTPQISCSSLRPKFPTSLSPSILWELRSPISERTRHSNEKPTDNNARENGLDC